MKLVLIIIPIIFIIYEAYKQKNFLTFGVFFNVLALLYLGYGTYELDSRDYYHDIIINSSVLAVIAFNLGYVYSRKSEIAFKPVKFNANYDIFMYTMMIFAFLIQLYLMISIGPDNFIFSDRVERARLLKPYGSLFFYEYWFNIAGIFALHRYFRTKNKKYLLVFVLCFSNLMFLSIVSISRSMILYSILPLIYYLKKMRKITNKHILIAGSSLLFIFMFMRGIMYSLFLGIETGETVQLGELVTWRRVFLNVLPTFEDFKLNGSSYLQTIYSFINPLYRGEALSTWYVKTYEYDHFLAGGGRGFSGVAEGYINFGYLGVFLYFLFIGYLFKFFQKRDYSFWIFICGSFLMVNTYRVFRSESYGVFKHWYWFIVIPIIVAYFFIQRVRLKHNS